MCVQVAFYNVGEPQIFILTRLRRRVVGNHFVFYNIIDFYVTMMYL